MTLTLALWCLCCHKQNLLMRKYWEMANVNFCDRWMNRQTDEHTNRQSDSFSSPFLPKNDTKIYIKIYKKKQENKQFHTVRKRLRAGRAWVGVPTLGQQAACRSGTLPSRRWRPRMLASPAPQ